MQTFRVLVLGGYGFFGQRLVTRLCRHSDLHVLIAGRSLAAGRSVVQASEAHSKAQVEAVRLDARAAAFGDELRRLAPQVVVDAAGPFQGADYRIPSACIAAGIHYVDLADSRDFVGGIGGLHDAATAAGVTVTSGASSVPALSSAVADHLAHDLSEVHFIDIGISPGNRTQRGLSTVRGVLSYCGKSIPTPTGAAVFGWTATRRQTYPAPVGTRLLSPCDVPDFALLPGRYAGTPIVQFGAGLELQLLHRGMNAMAWMVRAGLVSDWSRHAKLLKWIADLFQNWGSDAGAMHVTLRGLGANGQPVNRTWELVATQGHGPFVPTLAAAALVRKLRSGWRQPGAFPCMGLLSLSDFEHEMEGLAITTGRST